MKRIRLQIDRLFWSTHTRARVRRLGCSKPMTRWTLGKMLFNHSIHVSIFVFFFRNVVCLVSAFVVVTNDKKQQIKQFKVKH